MPLSTLGITIAPWRLGHRVWGQRSTIEFLINLGWWWDFSWNPYGDAPYSEIYIGDISPEGGAHPERDKVLDHTTHKNGLDVDIFFVRNDGQPKAGVIGQSSYSLEENIRLGKAIVRTAKKLNLHIPGHFFYGNDKKVQAEVPGLITKTNHEDHFHVNLVPPHLMPK